MQEQAALPITFHQTLAKIVTSYTVMIQME
jgi:hypothetical protein